MFDASIEQRSTLQSMYQDASMLTFENEQFIPPSRSADQSNVLQQHIEPSPSPSPSPSHVTIWLLGLLGLSHQRTFTFPNPTRAGKFLLLNSNCIINMLL